ncbi:PHD finger protein 20 [Bombina bombina]|uniref:PHD finger protein 20 n=1 Tax=Bombina bombina TaxID=8345 RepID=UPI00235A9088|nr:PHD finger protein 20 [Bombina bombina]
MTKHPPNRRGITFEVGAQLEARDRLKKWYAAHIEEIDYEEGKVLIHFKRWNHRYDEWFCWDSPYLRPLEKIQLRREGLVEDEPPVVFRVNEQVLACWSDCRFYPAKIISVNKDGTYTVKFFDGVIQAVKNIHVKAFTKDQANVSRSKPREKSKERTSPPVNQREKFREQKKTAGNTFEKEQNLVPDKKPAQPEKGKKTLVCEKNKLPEKNSAKIEKEDKENISEESSVESHFDEKSTQNDSLKVQLENGERKKRDRSSSLPSSDPASQTLQPITLELRRRKISIGSDVQTKRPRLDKSTSATVKVENGVSSEELHSNTESMFEKENGRRSSRMSSCENEDNLPVIDGIPVTPADKEESSLEDISVSQKADDVQKISSTEKAEEVGNESKPKAEASTISDVEQPRNNSEPLLVDPEETSTLTSSLPDIKAEDQDVPVQNEVKEVNAVVTAPMKRNPRSDNSAKYSREPLTNTLKKTDDPAPKAVTMELDPNRFKCKFLDCSKSFRKAKLLHYHMKYFHGVEKAEQEQSPLTRHMQTRGSLAHEKANQEAPKRRRTTSGSLSKKDTPLQVSLRSSPQDAKADKLNEKRRHSTPAMNGSSVSRPSLREKSKENLIEKAHLKPERTAEIELSGSEENIDISKELSPKKLLPSNPSDLKTNCSVKIIPLKSSDHSRRRDSSKISDDDMLSDSCTESLLWSDDDYNEEIDVTNADEELEEDGDCEIVRCMCEVQEENDFMIQCEQCLCWQHGVCMGLLEENVPEKYTCYVCQDPPGQRLSLKYWYDREWLNNGHMHGLPFLEDNYSHQNAKKIVATHKLLGDVQRVIEVLHGLQLKMSILQSKDHPDLRYWVQPWKQHVNEKCFINRNSEESCCKEDVTNYRTLNGAMDKPSSVPSVEESYITSEHCYQKPRTYYPALEQRLVVETRSSTLDTGVDRIRQSREDSLAERLGWDLDRELIKTDSESKHNYCKVRDCMSKKNPPQESMNTQFTDNRDGVVSSQLQWQLNLLAHLESLQDEVTHRMDFIEKELDVLESFLDYTGELEPPEPLARLPQLKHRIKQLLMDLGKVEQIAFCCST